MVSLVGDSERRASLVEQYVQLEFESKRKRDEDRRRREDAEHESRMAVSACQLVSEQEKIENARRERERSDQAFKMKVVEFEETRKKRRVAEIEDRIQKCTDTKDRDSLQARLDLVEGMPTGTTLVLNNNKVERPARLQQQVLSTFNGSELEYRFPVGMTLMDANLENRVTVAEYARLAYPSVKLTPEDVKKLGLRVASVASRRSVNDVQVPMKKMVDGAKYPANQHFVRDLIGPPLDEVFEKFMKEVSEREQAPSVVMSTGPLDKFVKTVVGTPVHTTDANLGRRE